MFNNFVLFFVSFAGRALDAGLLTSDGFYNYPQRYVFMNIGQVIQFQSAVYFLYAIVHSIPNAYLDSQGRMRNSLLPPRWVFVSFCAVTVVL